MSTFKSTYQLTVKESNSCGDNATCLGRSPLRLALQESIATMGVLTSSTSSCNHALNVVGKRKIDGGEAKLLQTEIENQSHDDIMETEDKRQRL